MSTSGREVTVVEGEDGMEVMLPEDIEAKLEGSVLIVSGPLGVCRKDFSRIPVDLHVEGDRVRIRPMMGKKRGYSVMKTSASHVRNLAEGVLRGYLYRLKIAYAHFPISVRVQGGLVLVENFLGERSPRSASIVGERTTVRVEGDDVLVEGPCLEEVGQTAANIELATKVKGRDSRVFLDGVYIYERKVQARS